MTQAQTDAQQELEEVIDLASVDDAGPDDEGFEEDEYEEREAAPERKPDARFSDAAKEAPIRVLEALLFAASAPLTTNAIRDRMPPGADVGGLLMELQQTYEGRGIHLVEMDGTWAFRTAGDLADTLQISREVKRKLSRAAMETLAIIAYHQPVTRAEIESIRGVATHKGMLDVLIEAGWVKPGRRRETPGRPLTWITTASFLDHFGLQAINDLPGLDDLKASGLLDRRPAIETLGDTGDLFGDEADIAEDAAYDHLAEDEEELSASSEGAAEESVEDEEGEF